MWHLSREVRGDGLRALDAVARLCLVEAEAVDDLGDLGRGGGGEVRGRGPAAEELGRHAVDLRVGGLGRQQYRDHQVERALVVEEALDGAVLLVQAPAHLDGARGLRGLGLARHGALPSLGAKAAGRAPAPPSASTANRCR